MFVEIKTHHVVLPSHGGRELAQRARAVLQRLANGIARIEMTLKDINGPRGGIDKECVLRAELVDGRHIIVIDRDVSMRRAIGNALRRARNLIAGELRRRRSRQRGIGRQRDVDPARSLLA